MHLLKPKEILRIHDAVIERFGGLKTSPRKFFPKPKLSSAASVPR